MISFLLTLTTIIGVAVFIRIKLEKALLPQLPHSLHAS
jgi:hypothetical protein